MITNNDVAQPAGAGVDAPERIRVVVRAATSDDWIGVAYQKDYTGDPSAIHEYVRADRTPPPDLHQRARRAADVWYNSLIYYLPAKERERLADIIAAEFGGGGGGEGRTT